MEDKPIKARDYEAMYSGGLADADYSEIELRLMARAVEIKAEAHHIKPTGYGATRTGRFSAAKPKQSNPARKAKRKAQRKARAITRKKG